MTYKVRVAHTEAPFSGGPRAHTHDLHCFQSCACPSVCARHLEGMCTSMRPPTPRHRGAGEYGERRRREAYIVVRRRASSAGQRLRRRVHLRTPCAPPLAFPLCFLPLLYESYRETGRRAISAACTSRPVHMSTPPWRVPSCLPLCVCRRKLLASTHAHRANTPPSTMRNDLTLCGALPISSGAAGSHVARATRAAFRG